MVEGRLQIRSYDAKDGSKRWVTEVIVNHAEFIERKEQASQQPAPQSMESFGQQVPFDEEIPF